MKQPLLVEQEGVVSHGFQFPNHYEILIGNKTGYDAVFLR